MKTNPISRRTLFLLLIVILLSVFPIQPASAASQEPEDKTVELKMVSYHGSTLVMNFKVTGFTSLTDLRGSIFVDKKFNVIHCEWSQTHEAKCFADGMRRYRGRNARVWFAGLAFYIKMPGELPNYR
jgi:hypothetical protein